MGSPHNASDEDMFEDVKKEADRAEIKEAVGEEESEAKALAGKLRSAIAGIPPPPAITEPKMDVHVLLSLWYAHKNDMMWESQSEKKTVDDADRATFGVYINRCCASEEIERLRKRYQERWVASETESVISGSKCKKMTASAKKRARRNGWAVSPGSRLSHLALRRTTFAPPLQSSNTRLIAVQPKGKADDGKKKKDGKGLPKRALFMSPEKPALQGSSVVTTPRNGVQKLAGLMKQWQRVEKETGTPKRKRSLEDRRSSGKKRRREEEGRKAVNRSLTFSDEGPPGQEKTLSSTHRQKLLWAVADALREWGVRSADPRFRPSASALFKICCRKWLDDSSCRPNDSEGVSNAMLQLARSFLPTVLVAKEPSNSEEGLSRVKVELSGRLAGRALESHNPKGDWCRVEVADASTLHLFVPTSLLTPDDPARPVDITAIARKVARLASDCTRHLYSGKSRGISPLKRTPKRRRGLSRLAESPGRKAPQLSLAHKQKMMWAVTEALKKAGRNMNDASWRPLVILLTRRVGRAWQEASKTKKGSTSERMLAIAQAALPSVLDTYLKEKEKCEPKETSNPSEITPSKREEAPDRKSGKVTRVVVSLEASEDKPAVPSSQTLELTLPSDLTDAYIDTTRIADYLSKALPGSQSVS